MSGEDPIEEDRIRVESSSDKGIGGCGKVALRMAEISGGVGT